MSKITITRRLTFAAGHRIYGHESKCAHLHGHNYVVELTAVQRTGELDKLGRVIDFAVLKSLVGGWLEQEWDHKMILKCDDPLGTLLLDEAKHIYYLPTNPTAENMARYLLDEICPELLRSTDVDVMRVKLWETENCYAVAEK
jgi:6-pyruvoyltetrahydropterin/6-carboxytetrahydropterin synthase